jgi:hypothetical protein
MSVPKNMQEKYNEIEPLITKFCEEKLNDEYKDLSLRLCEKLCRKRPSPLLSGKANTWACTIIYTIGSVNFIFDKSQVPTMTAKEIAESFGISASTAGNKASQIRDMLNISPFEPEWTLPSKISDNPLVWMVEVDGFVIDVRILPLEVQIQAYKAGIIPYVPALKDEGLKK